VENLDHSSSSVEPEGLTRSETLGEKYRKGTSKDFGKCGRE